MESTGAKEEKREKIDVLAGTLLPQHSEKFTKDLRT
jgi:hypothetical protein